MIDPQAPTSRGSKTAAVVIFVVFLQVLLVAVLGLSGMASNRKEARRRAEEKGQADAIGALGKVVQTAADTVKGTLEDVRVRVRSYRDLQWLRSSGHGDHADLVQTIYHVDPDSGEILWLDGVHRLYVPPRGREAEIKANATPEMDAVYEHYRRGVDSDVLDDLPRLQNALQILRHFPYRQDRDGYPLALGEAKRLVPWARSVADWRADMADGPEAFATLENVLLAALEVVTLNRDRVADLPWADRALLDATREEVQAASTGLPSDQVAVRSDVEAYDDARRALDGGMRDVIGLALGALGGEPRVARYDRFLVGLVPDVPLPIAPSQGSMVRHHGVVVLNERAVLDLLEEAGRSSELSRQGLLLRVSPVGEPAPTDYAAARELGPEPWLHIPFRATLLRVHPYALPSEGPGEPFYWVIILLATGGLAMGAYVLSRLYTREVRLARLKADFVSSLSHELKTPLTSIMMFTEMLQDGQLTTEADRTEGLAVLAQETQRLQGIVARMLDVARREARGTPYDLVVGDLNEVVSKAVERFRRIVTEPGLDLGTALAPGPLEVAMDAAATDDVVTNLLTNAWKYRRGEAARIRVATARVGRRAELVVSDDGLGIARRDRRRVFEVFYRAEAYLTKVSGTGLGLALVRTIVRAHRGSIRIETGDEGVGTRFRIRFPLAASGRRSTSASLPVGSDPRPEAASRSEANATP